MSDETMLVFGEDGVAREYDDTWDITIHCESEEEQDKAWKKLKSMEWIPCSERLPEQYGNYLVSIEGEEPDIGSINPDDPRGWSLCDANGFYWANDKRLNVIAWMPLPEPYKGE